MELNLVLLCVLETCKKIKLLTHSFSARDDWLGESCDLATLSEIVKLLSYQITSYFACSIEFELA